MITKDELTQFRKMMAVDYQARYITRIITCLSAIPHFPANEETRQGYVDQLEKACADMEKELSNG